VGTLSNHHCATVGHGTYKLVRSYRLPLRLLRTHTEVCTITVVDAPLGAVVTTVGALTPEARAAVQGVLAGATAGRTTPTRIERPANAAWSLPAPAPIPPTPAPVIPVSDLTTVRPRPPAPAPAAPSTDHTTIRPRPPAPAASPRATAVLRFDTGQVVEVGGTTVVVGRNPLALATDGQARTVAVPDPGHTVSKTHFACGQDDRGVWLEDRHSTNGTSVSDAMGRRAALAPGRRTLVTVDVTVTFGDHRAKLTLRP
jgi:hypothetical protein